MAGLPKVDGDKLEVQTGIGIPPPRSVEKRGKTKEEEPSKERRMLKDDNPFPFRSSRCLIFLFCWGLCGNRVNDNLHSRYLAGFFLLGKRRRNR